MADTCVCGVCGVCSVTREAAPGYQRSLPAVATSYSLQVARAEARAVASLTGRGKVVEPKPAVSSARRCCARAFGSAFP